MTSWQSAPDLRLSSMRFSCPAPEKNQSVSWSRGVGCWWAPGDPVFAGEPPVSFWHSRSDLRLSSMRFSCPAPEKNQSVSWSRGVGCWWAPGDPVFAGEPPVSFWHSRSDLRRWGDCRRSRCEALGGCVDPTGDCALASTALLMRAVRPSGALKPRRSGDLSPAPLRALYAPPVHNRSPRRPLLPALFLASRRRGEPLPASVTILFRLALADEGTVIRLWPSHFFPALFFLFSRPVSSPGGDPRTAVERLLFFLFLEGRLRARKEKIFFIFFQEELVLRTGTVIRL